MQSRLQQYPWEHCKYCPFVSNSGHLPISRFRSLQTVTGVGFSYFIFCMKALNLLPASVLNSFSECFSSVNFLLQEKCVNAPSVARVSDSSLHHNLCFSAGVRLGEHDISTVKDCYTVRTMQGEDQVCAPKVQDVAIAKVIVHPDYVRQNYWSSDIGLIKLKKPANLTRSNIGRICLPIMEPSDRTGVVTGWGRTEAGKPLVED